MDKFFGKYRGKVKNNIDPMQQGRVQVEVAALPGLALNWALPSVPFPGFFFLPPSGSAVWVEFEGGDVNRPIYTGFFWENPTDVPATPAIAEMKVIKTGQTTITINDLVGGITVEWGGMKIALAVSGVEITNGQGGTITMQGPQVSVNNGALEVI